MKILLASPMKPYPPFINGMDDLYLNYGNCTYGQGYSRLITA